MRQRIFVQDARTAEKTFGGTSSSIQEQPIEDGVPLTDTLRHTGLAGHTYERDSPIPA